MCLKPFERCLPVGSLGWRDGQTQKNTPGDEGGGQSLLNLELFIGLWGLGFRAKDLGFRVQGLG